MRAPHTARPWITLACGTLVTAFVGFERVRSGAHFPSDVVAGSLAGAAVGLLVPLIHRRYPDERTFWLGMTPGPGGGTLRLRTTF